MLQSRRLGMWLASLPLWFAASCGVTAESEDSTGAEDSVEQSLGPDCKIRRPYGWHQGAFSCSESVRNSTLTLSPGESFQMTGPNGQVTVVCHANGDGRWDEVDKWCGPGGPAIRAR